MRRSYSQGEVKKMLVEGYAELREAKDTSRRGLRVLIWLSDLDRAMKLLPLRERRVVLVHGMLGYTIRECVHLLGLSPPTLVEDYRRGIEALTNRMNGDTAL